MKLYEIPVLFKNSSLRELENLGLDNKDLPETEEGTITIDIECLVSFNDDGNGNTWARFADGFGVSVRIPYQRFKAFVHNNISVVFQWE